MCSPDAYYRTNGFESAHVFGLRGANCIGYIIQPDGGKIAAVWHSKDGTRINGPADENLVHHQKEYDKLNGLSGADFDKEYIDQMVTDHAKALRAFTSEAKDTKDAKFRAVVLQDKTMVAAHKNMAYDLKKKL